MEDYILKFGCGSLRRPWSEGEAKSWILKRVECLRVDARTFELYTFACVCLLVPLGSTKYFIGYKEVSVEVNTLYIRK